MTIQRMQTSLLHYFKKEEIKPPFPLAKATAKAKATITQQEAEAKAKELLEPLFTRAIPENLKYRKQLEEEYTLIDTNHFTPVFLQVRKIFQLIEEIGEETNKPIPHIIRGSAGSSLVCYFLGITHIDPIQYGIQLARFMNKERKDMPDIDIDVPYNRREEIYAKIAKTWPGMMARISNHVKYSSKVAIREAAKEVLGVDVMPQSLRKKDFSLKTLFTDQQQKQIASIAEKKLGTLKHHSLHCGGLVIFEKEGEVPKDLILKEVESNGVKFAQLKLNKDETEDAGFIKIDLLSNRGLAQLADLHPTLPLTQYPSRNFGVEYILEKGLTIGITFAESRGMRKLFMSMKPTSVKDVAIALALIRPAAAAEGRKQDYLMKWSLPELQLKDPILRPIVFDDDAILKIKSALHCSSAEADVWRKHFAKGKKDKIQEFRRKMYSLNYSEEIIEKVIDDLSQLIHYSFCKSHAISYAQLVWALAYWKWHTPHQFWTSALNHCQSEYRKWVHYREAKCSGLTLSRSPPPYKVGVRDGHPALIPVKGEQSLLHQKTSLEEIKELGYWTQEEFLPKCGMWKDSQTRLDNKTLVRFCGPIATGRVVDREWGEATMVCIGIGNKRYMDLLIPEKRRSDLFHYFLVEGTGFLVQKDGIEHIEVQRVRGKSLSSL